MNHTANESGPAKTAAPSKTVITAEMDNVATMTLLLHQQTAGKSVMCTDGKNKCEIKAGLCDSDKQRVHELIEWAVATLTPILKGLWPKESGLDCTPSDTPADFTSTSVRRSDSGE
jgi:hypothetical protein